MIAKFYSEMLDKYFDREEDCIKAETLEKERLEKENQPKIEISEFENTNTVSKQKKELAKAVEDADVELSEAYTNLELAKKEASKMIAEARVKAKDIVSPAEQKLYDAYEKKYKAIAEFNDKFGTYSMIYTGNRAAQEFGRVKNELSNIYRDFFNFFI